MIYKLEKFTLLYWNKGHKAKKSESKKRTGNFVLTAKLQGSGKSL